MNKKEWFYTFASTKNKDSPWKAVRLCHFCLVHATITLLTSRWIFHTLPTDGTFATNPRITRSVCFKFARRASSTIRCSWFAHGKIIWTFVTCDMIFCKLFVVRVVFARGTCIAFNRPNCIGVVPTWAVFAFFKTISCGWRKRSSNAFLASCARRSTRNVRVFPLGTSFADRSWGCSRCVTVGAFGAHFAFKETKSFWIFAWWALHAGVAAGNFEAAFFASAVKKRETRKQKGEVLKSVVDE